MNKENERGILEEVSKIEGPTQNIQREEVVKAVRKMEWKGRRTILSNNRYGKGTG